MAGLLDYLAWRGDISLRTSPWNPVDALLMATMSYIRFHGVDSAEGWTLEEVKRLELAEPSDREKDIPRQRMFEAMADSVRFRQTRLHHYIALTDEEKEMQFSAICLDLPDGSLCLAFRGTDNTLVGWKEDFNMAYQASVPAQEAAAYYLCRAAENTEAPIRLVGHSKGGNLAAYAAAVAPEEVQRRIEAIYSFDGPGMNDEMFASEGYARVRERIQHFIPQGSIIGLLMNFHTPYTVVRSTAVGIAQHDPMTWQVYGPRFETMETIEPAAALTRDTLHDWLEGSTYDQRATFVETLFRLMETTKATRMSDITSEKWKSLMTILGNRKEVDPDTRRVFNRLMAQGISLGFGNAVEMVRGHKEPEGNQDAAGENASRDT